MDLKADVITFITALLSCFISLLSILIAYKSNKENNNAKLSERAFEKRLDAFKELDEHVGRVLYYCSEKNVTDANFFEQLETLYEDLYNCHQKQRVFLTPQIDNEIDRYLSIIYEYKRKKRDHKSIDAYTDFYKSLKKQRYSFINDVQKLLGYVDIDNSKSF